VEIAQELWSSYEAKETRTAQTYETHALTARIASAIRGALRRDDEDVSNNLVNWYVWLEGSLEVLSGETFAAVN